MKVTVRVVRGWKTFPGDVVDAPALAVLRARLDEASSSLVWWEVLLLIEGGVGTR